MNPGAGRCYRLPFDGMTAKISISVPDDVAQWLAGKGRNRASGALTEAARAMMRREQFEQLQLSHGRPLPSPEGRARARRLLDDAAATGPARSAQAHAELQRRIAAGDPPDPRR